MHAQNKSDDKYEKMYENSDSLTLIKTIKGIAYEFESQKNIYLALDNAKCAFYSYHQGSDEMNTDYMSRFKNTLEVIKHYGGNIGDNKALVREELTLAGCDPTKATEDQSKAAKESAKSKAHAMAFLKRADKARYGQRTTELENQFTRGTAQYPTSVTKTYLI